MSRPTPMASELARAILTYELGARQTPEALGIAMERCCHRLNHALVNLVGEVGFAALLSRAAQLTRPTADWIDLILRPPAPTISAMALTTIAQREGVPQLLSGLTLWLAHLLSLLSTFIGEELTLRLVRRTWTLIIWDAPAADSGEGT